MKFLKRLFSAQIEIKDPLAALAAFPDRRNEFLGVLATSRILIVTTGSALEEDNLDEKKLLEHIGKNSKDFQNVKSAEDVKPFTYKLNGQGVLPVFSCQERFTEFVEGGGEHKLFDKFYAFLGLDVDFGYLLNDEFLDYAIVLNPTTHAETCISIKERFVLHKALSET